MRLSAMTSGHSTGIEVAADARLESAYDERYAFDDVW
jgi:hypothetical protein